MKHSVFKYLLACFIVIGIVVIFCDPVINQIQATQKTQFKSYFKTSSTPQIAKDRIIVKFKKTTTETQKNQFVTRKNLKRKSPIRTTNLEQITIPQGANPETLALQLTKDEKNTIEFAEVDKLVSPDVIVNDPYISSQWHLATMKAPQAWEYMRATNIPVAVCDTGVDITHPDLSGVVLTHLGYNTVDHSTNFVPINPHGTMVSGVIAAVTNNGIGVSGVTWGATIIPIKVSFDGSGSAYTSALAECISYAADHGAKVINLSYSGVAGSQTIDNVSQYAESKGAVVVVAAANNGVNLTYPNYDSIVVASATDQSDRLAGFSNYGNFVDVAAPGVNILTTTMGGGYGSVNGTSFSAPNTAAILALIFAARPSFTPAQAKNTLFTTVDDIGATGKDIYFGYGRVNAFKTVTSLVGEPYITPTPTIGPSPTVTPIPTATLTPTPKQTPTPIIKAPTLTATVMGSSEVSLVWNSVINTNRYMIYRNGLGVHGVNATEYLDGGLSPNTTYTYQVEPFNDMTGPIGPRSNSVTVTTLPNTYIPTPLPTNIPQAIVKGRFIDYFTKNAVPGVKLIPVNNAQYAGFTISNSNGEFFIQSRIDHLSNTDSSKWNISFVYYPDCYYYADWLTISRNNNGIAYVSSNPFDLLSKSNTYYAINNTITTGNIPLWPALNSFTVTSDVPVNMKLNYPEEGKSYGQNGYSTKIQMGGNIIPFNYPLHLQLTDQSGKIFQSTYTYDRSLGCSYKPQVTFQNGIFTWR